MSQGKVDERPDEYEADLHPDNRAGQHAGVTETPMIPAYDIKELHEMLSQFRDDEMKQLMVLAPGARLEQGAIYYDLRHPEKGEFKAMGGMEAGPGDYYVPKGETDYVLWNRLIGVDNPDRLDVAAGPP